MGSTRVGGCSRAAYSRRGEWREGEGAREVSVRDTLSRSRYGIGKTGTCDEHSRRSLQTAKRKDNQQCRLRDLYDRLIVERRADEALTTVANDRYNRHTWDSGLERNEDKQ